MITTDLAEDQHKKQTATNPQMNFNYDQWPVIVVARRSQPEFP